MNREQIEAFFRDCIINGVSRDVVFPEDQEEGRIEVDLVAPLQVKMETIHLSFPADEEAAE